MVGLAGSEGLEDRPTKNASGGCGYTGSKGRSASRLVDNDCATRVSDGSAPAATDQPVPHALEFLMH